MKLIALMSEEGQVITYVSDSNFTAPKVEEVLQKVVDYKDATTKMAETVGFDICKEVYLKGKDSLLLIHPVHQCMLILYFEMKELKVEFFDCEHFMATLDDFNVRLH